VLYNPENPVNLPAVQDFGRRVCGYDFNAFNDFNDFNDLNDLNDLFPSSFAFWFFLER